MNKIDYEKIGFKSGLEIHQQLDTGKLFCKCPGYLRNDSPEYEVKRKLHAVAGETGEVDDAVRHEADLDREFIYQGYNDNCCLIDLDEEPPKEINEKALDEVLKIALLLNCEIYPVSQIMRKTVINGSNTSGFQRTLLVAHDGWIETEFGRVRIESICLEEDSARIVEKSDKKAIYRLDRLGIPLVEIATAPDMKNPMQVKEAALKLGEIIRSCKVKRGIGTIRQDLNMSIRNHGRVEIKGFQDPAMIVKTIDNEILRQQREIKEGKTLGEVRNALPNGDSEFLRPMPGKARMYPETDLLLLKISREKINNIKKILPKTRGEISQELKKRGLNDELISLIIDGNLEEFNILMKVYSDSNLVAKMITLWRFEIASKMKKTSEDIKGIINERVLEEILEKLNDKKIEKRDVKEILQKIAEGKNLEEASNIEKLEDDEIKEEINKIIKEKPGLRPNAYMGLAMTKFKGKLDAKKAMEFITECVSSKE
jgi:Glu-tRNA(Gln) amidotransferase subunit E-like FAD-binding protein